MTAEAPEPRTVGHCVGVIHRFARRFFAMLLEPLDLPEVAFPLLMRLMRQEAVSQDELAEIHLVDKSTVARALARMEEAGLVRRTVDSEDRRVKHVQITERGMALESQIQRALAAWNERLLEGFSVQQTRETLTYLRRLADNASRHRDALDDHPELMLTLPDDE